MWRLKCAFISLDKLIHWIQAIATARQCLTTTHCQLREHAVQEVIGVGTATGLTKIQHVYYFSLNEQYPIT